MSMKDLNERKKELRYQCRQRGIVLSDEYRKQADREIRDAVTDSIYWKQAERVFVYVSMWSEPDTRQLICEALAEGKQVAVPLCCGKHSMKAVRIRSLRDLQPGTLNIPEPTDPQKEMRPEEIDLAVVPCVTVSRNGMRLGHGAGYYDRFLKELKGISMCLCYGIMLTEDIPSDEQDVPIDVIITDEIPNQ